MRGPEQYIKASALAVETGVNYETILRWCKNAVDKANGVLPVRSTPIKGVKKDDSGYWLIRRENIGRVKNYIEERKRGDH